MSDHLKYLTEHLPATFAFAGIDVVNGLSGVRGAQILGRSVVLGTEPFPYDAERRWPPWRAGCGCTATSPARCSATPGTCTGAPAA